MFGGDACVKMSSSGAGVFFLDKAQCDILNESWRISTPSRHTAYRDSYKSSVPVHDRSEEFLKSPVLTIVLLYFLIKRHSGKATFKRARSLFTAHFKRNGKTGVSRTGSSANGYYHIPISTACFGLSASRVV